MPRKKATDGDEGTAPTPKTPRAKRPATILKDIQALSEEAFEEFSRGFEELVRQRQAKPASPFDTKRFPWLSQFTKLEISSDSPQDNNQERVDLSIFFTLGEVGCGIWIRANGDTEGNYFGEYVFDIGEQEFKVSEAHLTWEDVLEQLTATEFPNAAKALGCTRENLSEGLGVLVCHIAGTLKDNSREVFEGFMP